MHQRCAYLIRDQTFCFSITHLPLFAGEKCIKSIRLRFLHSFTNLLLLRCRAFYRNIMHFNPTFVFIALLSIVHAAPLNGPKNTDLINKALQVQPGRLVNVIFQGNEVDPGSSEQYKQNAEKILEAWYKSTKMVIPEGGFYIVTSGNSGKNRDGTLEFSVWGPAVSEKCQYEHSGCLIKYTPETQSVTIIGGPARSLLSRFSLA